MTPTSMPLAPREGAEPPTAIVQPSAQIDEEVVEWLVTSSDSPGRATCEPVPFDLVPFDRVQRESAGPVPA